MMERYPFALDTDLTRKMAPDEVHAALLPIIRSNRYSLSETLDTVCVQGPDTCYHDIDPYLDEGSAALGIDRTQQELATFHRQQSHFDLCLEDSWSGKWMSKALASLDRSAPLTILHLDDHTDMMPTMLEHRDGSLFDPIHQRVFDPYAPQDWDAVITSGAVGIGSFLTPFFYLDRPVKILHLKDEIGDLNTHTIAPSKLTHSLLSGRAFLDISHAQPDPTDSAASKSYVSGQSAEDLVAQIDDQALLLVHIDLDYFINDFNGNPFDGDYLPGDDLQARAVEKIARLFTALRGSKITVAKWIIGTSPGFCSGFHWAFLLRMLEEEIARL
jgi:hypothetical protein